MNECRARLQCFVLVRCGSFVNFDSFYNLRSGTGTNFAVKVIYCCREITATFHFENSLRAWFLPIHIIYMLFCCFIHGRIRYFVPWIVKIIYKIIINNYFWLKFSKAIVFKVFLEPDMFVLSVWPMVLIKESKLEQLLKALMISAVWLGLLMMRPTQTRLYRLYDLYS